MGSMELIVHPTWSSSLRPHSRNQSLCNKHRAGYILASHYSSRSIKQTHLHYHQQWTNMQPVILKKGARFKVSSFKGNPHCDDEGATLRGSKLAEKPFNLSYMEKRGETLVESSDLINQVPSAVHDQVAIAGLPTIRKLLNKWLVVLRTQALNSATEEPEKDEKSQNEMLEVKPVECRSSEEKLLKAAVQFFWSLDPIIKLPLLIFPPSYLAVRLFYGANVARELMPLWIAGPLVLAQYIKMIRGVFKIYLSCFKKVENLVTFFIITPAMFCVGVVRYIVEGKLKANLHKFVVQPIEDLRSMDHKEFFLEKWKESKQLCRNKWLDYVESVWPYYFRTVRFLKQCGFI